MHNTRKNETPESPYPRPTKFEFKPDSPNSPLGQIVEVPMTDDELLADHFRAGARGNLTKTITNWPNKPLTYPDAPSEIQV